MSTIQNTSGLLRHQFLPTFTRNKITHRLGYLAAMPETLTFSPPFCNPPHCYMPLPKERNWSSHVQHNLRSHPPSEASDPILSNFISNINPSTSEYLCNLFALPYTIWFFSLFFPSTSNVCFLLKDVARTWVSPGGSDSTWQSKLSHLLHSIPAARIQLKVWSWISLL